MPKSLFRNSHSEKCASIVMITAYTALPLLYSLRYWLWWSLLFLFCTLVFTSYKTLQVMGRSSPNDKLLLVKALRNGGHVVGVNGDGTNDAPALHEADIVLAMGIQATEVAKESADIIILDDDFASVVKVMGRSSPNDKLLLVKALRNGGHVVGVTGDGTNDAPALHEVFNEFNAQKPDEMNIFSGMTRNDLFMGIIGVTVLLQVLIIEFLGKFAKTVRLSRKPWLVSIPIGVISWPPLALIGKLIIVPETPFSEFFAPVSRCFRRPNKSRENGHESDGQEDDAKN